MMTVVREFYMDEFGTDDPEDIALLADCGVEVEVTDEYVEEEEDLWDFREWE